MAMVDSAPDSAAPTAPAHRDNAATAGGDSDADAAADAANADEVSTAAAGSRASSMVRYPASAPPISRTAFVPPQNADTQSPLESRCFRLAVRKKISRSAPEVPPIDPLIVSAMAAHNFEGFESGYLGAASRIAFAPRWNVIPQSPSPATWSHLVSSGSAWLSASHAARSMARSTAASPLPDDSASSASPPSTEESGVGVGGGTAAITSALARGGTEETAGHPGASVGLSKWARSVPSSSPLGSSPGLESGRGSSDTDTPCISRLVISGPATMRWASMPRLESALRHAVTMTNTSMGGVPPRLFTSKATFFGVDAIRPRVTFTISSAKASAGCQVDWRVPGSPWMPRPISMTSFPSSLSEGGVPGTVQVVSATPSVFTRLATRLAANSTSSREPPLAAKAPATLCTKTVPATPRPPVMPLPSGSAQSSATTTVATLIPSACARRAACPKLMRSPV
mmetsp:Transcript_17901/g.35350  ORF Transcript_17901/g.35350 Transcript_17901/m.35350 type:complete len:455 (-) Transcript_17901:380-1744(-)